MKSGLYKKIAGLSFFISSSNWTYFLILDFSSMVMDASSNILSTFTLVYIATLSPGSFLCDECQKANKSDSLFIICPKSKASYLRGRITPWFKLPISKVFTLIFIPIFSKSCFINKAEFASSGALPVEIENSKYIVFLFFFSVIVFCKNPSSPFFQPYLLKISCAFLSFSSYKISLSLFNF